MRADVARTPPRCCTASCTATSRCGSLAGFRVAEVSVRTTSASRQDKYGLARFWRGFVDLLTVRFLMIYESRPSHLFSGLGLASVAAGGSP